MQHVALKAADKAEYRALAAATALRLLAALPEQRQAAFLSFLPRMALCPKVGPSSLVQGLLLYMGQKYNCSYTV